MNNDFPEPPSPLTAGELQRRAVAGSTWTAVHTVVSLPIAFVANAIVARSLGVSSYGHLAFLTAAHRPGLRTREFRLQHGTHPGR